MLTPRKGKGQGSVKERRVLRIRSKSIGATGDEALRQEVRQRKMAERILQRQSEAFSKTLELLLREKELPGFLRAMLRAIISECGGLWTTFWIADESTGRVRRSLFQWRDAGLASRVEKFAKNRPELMDRLSIFYHELIHAEPRTHLVSIGDSRIPPSVRRFCREVGVHETLLVPLVLGNRLLGWISHQCPDVRLDAGQIAFVEGMAKQATLAVYLTRLREFEHGAERARESERRLREQERETIAVGRLLQVTIHDPSVNRIDAVLRSSLESTSKLLHGYWAVLWRDSNKLGFAQPVWTVLAGSPSVAVPIDASREIALTCYASGRAILKRWQVAGELSAGSAITPPMKKILALLGAPESAAKGDRLLCNPLVFDGESQGFILVLTNDPPARSSERRVAVKALALQAALALALDELSSVQRSAALTGERNRIARDLHDLLAQSFVGIALQVEAMRVECPTLPPRVEERLEKIRVRATQSAEELRRTLLMLRPTLLDECTVSEALSVLARETQSQAGVRVRFHGGAGVPRLTIEAEQHFFAIASEALQNAILHAAPTVVSISFQVLRQRVVLRVENNGRPLARTAATGSPSQHHGLANIRKRAAEMGAKFSFLTVRKSTRLEVAAPMERITILEP